MSELTIFMKSGNKVIVDRVTYWKYKYNYENITYLEINQKAKGFFKCRNKILVESINLNQIECITERV